MISPAQGVVSAESFTTKDTCVLQEAFGIQGLTHRADQRLRNHPAEFPLAPLSIWPNGTPPGGSYLAQCRDCGQPSGQTQVAVRPPALPYISVWCPHRIVTVPLTGVRQEPPPPRARQRCRGPHTAPGKQASLFSIHVPPSPSPAACWPRGRCRVCIWLRQLYSASKRRDAGECDLSQRSSPEARQAHFCGLDALGREGSTAHGDVQVQSGIQEDSAPRTQLTTLFPRPRNVGVAHGRECGTLGVGAPHVHREHRGLTVQDRCHFKSGK